MWNKSGINVEKPKVIVETWWNNCGNNVEIKWNKSGKNYKNISERLIRPNSQRVGTFKTAGDVLSAQVV